MGRRRLAGLLGWLGVVSIAIPACDGSNPVAPVGVGEPAPATEYTIGLSASPSLALAGITSQVTITVTIVNNATMQPPDDAPAVTLSTTAGTFEGGEALLTIAVAGGETTVTLDPGIVPGMAEILARSGDSAASLMLEIQDPGDPPIADFTFEVNEQTVLFTDTSEGVPTEWAWDFGDGSCPADPGCIEPRPSHTYTEPGTYQVSLTASNVSGASSKTQFVAVAQPPEAGFVWDDPVGLSVLFRDTSTGGPSSWLWTFGDGGTSLVQNPGHTFASAGVYAVTLEVANASGTSSLSQIVAVNASSGDLTANFEWDPPIGRSVVFRDLSLGGPTSWFWDFGDDETSTVQNPGHTYTRDGTYAVTLEVSNDSGSSSTSRLVSVSISSGG